MPIGQYRKVWKGEDTFLGLRRVQLVQVYQGAPEERRQSLALKFVESQQCLIYETEMWGSTEVS